MSIQSSINQAVNGMMSMIMPMSLLKEQGKVKQLKAEQEALKTSNDELKTSNEGLKTSNDELKTSNEELTKRNDYELEKWIDLRDRTPAYLDFLPFLNNPYSAGGDMASTVATQRVQSAQELRKSQMERLQKAFQNIGMGGDNNG